MGTGPEGALGAWDTRTCTLQAGDASRPRDRAWGFMPRHRGNQATVYQRLPPSPSPLDQEHWDPSSKTWSVWFCALTTGIPHDRLQKLLRDRKGPCLAPGDPPRYQSHSCPRRDRSQMRPQAWRGRASCPLSSRADRPEAD